MRAICLPRRLAAALLCCASLASCGFSPPLSPADRSTLADCRSEADRIYNAQNRAQLSERDSRDSPFSGAAQPGTPSDGLADRYSHENMVDDCVRHGTAEPIAAAPPK
jgi:hypothetical protein